jgi:hypothetical protein
MSRTIAALYDTRAEAEFARSRLVQDARARSPRIIGRDTVGAVDGLGIAETDKSTYRDGLRNGAFLLVAEAPGRADVEAIVGLLQDAAGRAEQRPEEQWGDNGPGVRVELPSDSGQAAPLRAAAPQHDLARARGPSPDTRSPDEDSAPRLSAPSDSASRQKSRRPWFEQRLRRGRDETPPSAARLRAFTRDAPVEEQVTLADEGYAVERRPSDRGLNESEIAAAGLFQEREFEFIETREEPVITKVPVMHEEVIVRKTVKERTETVRDTVRRTEVEVEDLPEDDEPNPALFGGRASRD